MGELMRGFDWSGTKLGDPREWSSELRTMVAACINSPLLGCVLWGPDLLFLYNDTYAVSLADRHPDALGRPVAEVWGDAWDQVKSPFLELLEQGGGFKQTDVQLDFERNGKPETTWWDISATSILDEDGRVAGILNQGVETTRQVRALQALKQSEAELSELNDTLEQQVTARTAERDRMWDTSPDLMLIIGFDGVFRRVNPAWTRLLGYAPEELVGQHVNDFVLPDDHDTTVEAYELAARGGSPRAENRYRHKDGSLRHISWVAAPAGEVTYATGRDVTAQREQAVALQQAEEQLRQSQKLEAVGQLTGGVAHDFNNLLTIIRSSVDFLRREDLAPERRARYVKAISDTADRATKLTNQLLAFARRQPLKPEVFEVSARVRDVSELIRPLMGSRIAIEVEGCPCPCHIEADTSQFETALVNLAVNARDAMDGEGTLSIRVREVDTVPAIRGHAGATGDFLAVSVADTGRGIDPDQIASIFEPFYTTKEVGKGTGLGLSQVFGFTKQSGGEVDVASEPGAGAAFTLYLPRVSGDGAETAGGKRGETVAAPVKRLSVLVVEDNHTVGQFAEEMLGDLGYDVHLVGNAADALGVLARGSADVDVVFSDVIMPGMNGVELAREVRRRHPELPIVLTSGYSTVLAQEGSHGFELLRKPYSMDELSRTLKAVTADALPQEA